MVQNFVANPWTSRTVSARPREPATVENRTTVGVLTDDELTSAQIGDRLYGLSPAQLDQIDAYEARTKNRKTVPDKIDTLRG